jgi:uncharacterized membrane protein
VTRRRSVPRDEGGQILIMAAAALILMVFCAALGVDIGGRAEVRRTDQKIADMAALDAVRNLSSDATTLGLAQQSASRNSFVDGQCAGQPLSITRGVWSTSFTPLSQEPGSAIPNAVEVTLCSAYKDFFTTGSAQLNGTAIAMNEAGAQFQIGSTLVQLTPLNGLLGDLGAGGTSLSLVGYNGLVGGNVTLAALGNALNTDLNLSLVTPTQILDATVTEGQLLEVAASLLSNAGESQAVVAVANAILASQNAGSKETFSIGQILGIEQGNGVGLGTTLNLGNLVNGGAYLANGKAGLSVPLTVGIPDLASATVNITGIVPAAASGFGPASTIGNSPGTPPTDWAQDTQVTVGFTLTIGDGALASLTLPLTLTVGGATGTLTSIDGCTSSAVSPTDIHVYTSFNDVGLAVGAASVNVLGAGIVSLTGTASIPSNAETATLDYPANFSPSGTAVTVNGSLGTPVVTLTPTLPLGLLTPIVQPILNTLVNTLVPGVLGSVVSAVDSDLNSLLGLDIGNASLLGLPTPMCTFPTLVQ